MSIEITLSIVSVLLSIAAVAIIWANRPGKPRGEVEKRLQGLGHVWYSESGRIDNLYSEAERLWRAIKELRAEEEPGDD